MVTGTDRRQLVTAEEIGEQLRLTARQVRDLANRGRIPVVRLSRKLVRFDRDEVLAAIGLPAKGDGSAASDNHAGSL